MTSIVIETHALGKTYFAGTPAEVVAVKSVDLVVEKGEFIAIMGASGSGKTTLMNLLGCLDKASTGTYRCRGVDVANLTLSARASLRSTSIGFVFQHFNLLPRMNALENVILPLDYTSQDRTKHRDIGLAALEAVSMSDRAFHFPSELSGGQQQRVAIARAIVNQPSIILADEPTGALDSNAGKKVLSIFKALQEIGRTIIIITHDRDVAEHGSRVLIMHDGELRAQRAPA